MQVQGLYLADCPGNRPCRNLTGECANNVPPLPLGCSSNYHGFHGKWDFQKESMYTSRPDAFSKDFSENQIKIINRMIEQKIRNYMENQNYDYYDK